VTELTAAAHAKVNLALAVTGTRDDGYHTLRSVFLRLALHDRLSVQVLPAAQEDQLEVVGGPAASRDDLVLRAAAALRTDLGSAPPALHFRLHKRIPAAAGLGGGSSDAAAAMDLALAAWGVRLDPATRLAVAVRLGADVPFFVAGHTAALVEGIGEQLTPLPAPMPAAGLVLITPAARLSTAAVFAEYDRLPLRSAGPQVDVVARALRAGSDGTTLAVTCQALSEANDLWSAAARLSATLGAARAAVSRVLGQAVLLTGSGPTLVAVYPSEAAAARAATRLREAAVPGLAAAEIMSTRTS